MSGGGGRGGGGCGADGGGGGGGGRGGGGCDADGGGGRGRPRIASAASHAASASGRKFVYCFSFSLSPLGPDPLQAVGFANLARIDSTKIKLQLDDQLFVDNSGNGGENLSSNRVSIYVLAYSYNVFRYIMGLGGKALV